MKTSKKYLKAVMCKDEYLNTVLKSAQKLEESIDAYKESFSSIRRSGLFHSVSNEQLSNDKMRMKNLIEMVADRQVVFGTRYSYENVLGLALKECKIDFDPAKIPGGLSLFDFLYSIVKWSGSIKPLEVGVCVSNGGLTETNSEIADVSYNDIVFFTPNQLEIGTAGVVGANHEERHLWNEGKNEDMIQGIADKLKIGLYESSFNLHYVMPLRYFDTGLFKPKQY